MCWPHVFRNLTPRLKHMKSLDAYLAKNVLADIEDLQWSDDKLQPKNALEGCFAYFRKVWVDSKEINWIEEANPFASSIESKNKETTTPSLGTRNESHAG